MASIDQHKTLFLLTPNLIGFVSKSRHAVEQYPKKKFRVMLCARWLEHIPCLKFSTLLLTLLVMWIYTESFFSVNVTQISITVVFQSFQKIKKQNSSFTK